jgi:hypothetical protein
MIVEHSMKWKSAYLNDHSRCVCLVWYGPSIHGWLIYYGHQEPSTIQCIPFHEIKYQHYLFVPRIATLGLK